MFENYLYIDEEKIDCYLSDFSRPSKTKEKTVCAEISLPFIKITTSGEFTKDISELSLRQKIVLFERLLENNELDLFFDLANEDVEAHTISMNRFVAFECTLRIPEMVDMINGASAILKGSLGSLAQKQIELNESEEQTQAILSLLSEKQETMPVIAESSIKAISEIDVEKIVDYDELDFWDEVAEQCTIIAKVTKNCSNEKRVKVVDLGKKFFGLSRSFRRKIPNYETNPQFNVFEDGVTFKIEILAIKK